MKIDKCVYNEETLLEWLEEDMICDEEEGFMQGYLAS